MATTTLYYRDDETLSESQGSSSDTISTNESGYRWTHRFDTYTVKIYHADTSTTQVGGTSVASMDRYINLGDNKGIQSDTWACPGASMVATDRIQIVDRVFCVQTGGPTSKTFLSAQLGWTVLNASTWTFYKYTRSYQAGDPPYAWTYYGNSTYDTRITNINYTSYADIGLRIRAGASTIKVGTLAVGTNALRIRKGATTYGIPLIATNDGSACGFRIYDGSAVKSIPEVA